MLGLEYALFVNGGNVIACLFIFGPHLVKVFITLLLDLCSKISAGGAPGIKPRLLYAVQELHPVLWFQPWDSGNINS